MHKQVRLTLALVISISILLVGVALLAMFIRTPPLEPFLSLASEAQEESREALERELAGEMVSISGGTFRMGDLSGEGSVNEKPVRTVTVSAFRLGKYEVTFAQWDACVADGGCNGYSPVDSSLVEVNVCVKGLACTYFSRGGKDWGRGNRPVINVSWDDAQSFIRWLNGRTGGNFRLPTEAEWEYAARAGAKTEYSWGDNIGSNLANCDGCGSLWDDDRTAPAGRFPANAWGLHDMHGNVWEWVQDCWNDNYAGAPTDGSAWESGDCSERVLRGGSWDDDARDLRSANRDWNVRNFNIFGYYGFRLAQDE